MSKWSLTTVTLVFFYVVVVVVNGPIAAENICPDRMALNNVSAYHNLDPTSYTEYTENINFYQLENSTIIHVVNANVSVLCEGMVNSFRYLQHLTFTNANITKIQAEAFKQLPKLTTLSLAVNHLTTIKKEHFKNLQRLTVLYLSANEIEIIDEDAFSELVNIKKIYLDKNKLYEINSGWFLNNRKLSLINLAFNRISKIQAEAFTLVRNAKLEIRLQHNAIEELVPGAVTCEGSIKEEKPQVIIQMDYNTLKEIPPGFVKSLNNFTSLVYLNNNVVDCVSTEILEELKTTSIELELNNNPINCDCMQQILKFIGDNTIQATFKYTSILECIWFDATPPPQWN